MQREGWPLTATTAKLQGARLEMLGKPDRVSAARSGSPVENHPKMKECANVPRSSSSDGQHLTDSCPPVRHPGEMPQDTEIGLSREVEDCLAFGEGSRAAW